jgi:hypothetical protein
MAQKVPGFARNGGSGMPGRFPYGELFTKLKKILGVLRGE